MRTVSSGVSDLDELLDDGILVGDNVVWVVDRDVFDSVDGPLLAGVSDGQPAVYVTMTQDPGQLARRLPANTEVLDARPGQVLSDPTQLARAVVERASHAGARIVIDDLDALAARLGPDSAVGFFTRTCPIFFSLGAIAYWRIGRRISPGVLDEIRKMTQCVIEIRRDQLHVIKAERRPFAEGKMVSADISNGHLRLGPDKAIGRLAAGLRKIRADRGLNQAELGRLAGVSPSAISQAESGTRGLGLDTLLRLSQALQVSLDEILANRTAGDYVLARRDNAATRTGITPMFEHAYHGLRGYLVELEPGESGSPRSLHKDAEAILVTSGLVKVDLGDETPVLRAGDAVLATRIPVRGWTNLLSTTSRLFWILREPDHVEGPPHGR